MGLLRSSYRSWIWQCRTELEMTRLLVLEAANQLDLHGNKKARGFLAMAKVKKTFVCAYSGLESWSLRCTGCGSKNRITSSRYGNSSSWWCRSVLWYCPGTSVGFCSDVEDCWWSRWGTSWDNRQAGGAESKAIGCFLLIWPAVAAAWTWWSRGRVNDQRMHPNDNISIYIYVAKKHFLVLTWCSHARINAGESASEGSEMGRNRSDFKSGLQCKAASLGANLNLRTNPETADVWREGFLYQKNYANAPVLYANEICRRFHVMQELGARSVVVLCKHPSRVWIVTLSVSKKL